MVRNTKSGGWYNEHNRHVLAGKGVKTGHNSHGSKRVVMSYAGKKSVFDKTFRNHFRSCKVGDIEEDGFVITERYPATSADPFSKIFYEYKGVQVEEHTHGMHEKTLVRDSENFHLYSLGIREGMTRERAKSVIDDMRE